VRSAVAKWIGLGSFQQRMAFNQEGCSWSAGQYLAHGWGAWGSMPRRHSLQEDRVDPTLEREADSA